MRLPGSLFLHNLVARRELLYQLVRRDFEKRYVGSFGGWTWGVIQPLVLLVSWVFVFQVCFKVQPQGVLAQNYPLYLFSAQLPWMLFADSLSRSSSSFVDNRNFITKTVFPVESIRSPSSCLLACSTLLVGGADRGHGHLGATEAHPPPLLPAAFLLGLFSVGLSWIVASLYVYSVTPPQLVGVVLTFWFRVYAHLH
ncbi:MAG: hypothetical protein U5J83_06970 [Bryobacterales bacterium]|nr:hypothetical protein [Bryobacterales bacterium]